MTNEAIMQNVNDDFTPFTDKELEAINRPMKLIAGEATQEQVKAIFRSVLARSK
jgi:hypothetical protein